MRFSFVEAAMHVEDHHPLEVLQRAEHLEPHARRRLHLRTLVLARQGWEALQIVEAIGLSRRTVQRVVQRYNREGLDGLEVRPGRGRKPLLSPEQTAAFLVRVEAGPAADEPVCTFTGAYLRRVLEEDFGVLYSLDGVYELLRRHGYAKLMPRPIHEDADPQAQEAFKKNSRPNSDRSPKTTPTSKSKSGSKMKQGSASRGR
jgi:transposase